MYKTIIEQRRHKHIRGQHWKVLLNEGTIEDWYYSGSMLVWTKSTQLPPRSSRDHYYWCPSVFLQEESQIELESSY
jgi:hypothetical protein